MASVLVMDESVMIVLLMMWVKWEKQMMKLA